MAVVSAGHRITERCAQAGQDRCLDRKAVHMGRLALEDLVDEVVDNVAVAAVEGLDQCRRVGAILKCERFARLPDYFPGC